MNYKIGAFLAVTLPAALLYFVFIEFYNLNDEENFKEPEYYSLPTEPQPIDNEDKLFDLNFRYVINNSNTCRSISNTTTLSAVILVTSYMGDVETRSAVRRAFSSQQLQELNIKRMFLLGVTSDDRFVNQKAIENENERFGDLIQGNFKEAYKNLTYKHMMGLRWAALHCKNAQYVIKMDDDIVISMHKIVELLKTSKLPAKNLLAGYVLRKMTPIREPANKWYVTRDEYPASFYPTFLSGWFYLTTPVVCENLFRMSLQVPYFWVDDVYVTGLLAQKIGVKHFNLGKLFTVHSEFLQCCIRDVEQSNYDCEVLLGPNGGDNNLFFKFNEAVNKCHYGRCVKRTKSLNQTCVAERTYPLGRGNALIETYKLV